MKNQCPFCGNELLPGDMFCIQCGRAVNTRQAPVQPVSPQPVQQAIPTQPPAQPAAPAPEARPAAMAQPAAPAPEERPAAMAQPATPAPEAPARRGAALKCPHCKKKNEEGMLFCIYCGGKMEELPAPPSKLPKEPKPQQDDFLPFPEAEAPFPADAENDADALFLDESMQQEPQPEEKKHKGILWLILILILLLLLLAGGVLYALGFFGDGNADPIIPHSTARQQATLSPVITPLPTVAPTTVPTAAPTPVPTAAPTAAPTSVPTAAPTSIPTAVPTAAPTPVPTVAPTATPRPTMTPVPALTARLASPVYCSGTGINRSGAIYSGPGTYYYRGANGKANVDFKASLYIWGEEDDWLMVSYEVTAGVDKGATRVGYVMMDDVPSSIIRQNDNDQLQFEYQLARLTRDVHIRDGNSSNMTPVGTLRTGDQVIFLASYGELDYVECQVNGKKMRGFIEGGVLLPM